MNVGRCLTAAAGVMLTTSLAYGLHARLSLQEIAQNADLIFVGTVSRQDSHYNAKRTMIETDVTFSDVRIEHETDRSKQRGANTIRLTYGGGTVGDVTVGVSDSPRFETGRRYLVFMIDDDSRPFNPVVGADQGMFEVISDPVTGQEYLRGRGRRAVVGVAENGDVRSTSRPLESISAGAPTFTASPAVVAPIADPLPLEPGGAVTSRAERVMDDTLETPMTIDSFVDHVKNVSLKKKVDKPEINRDGRGTFYRMVDGAIVVEPIKESVLQVETIDDKIGRVMGASLEAGAAAWYEPLMNCGRRQSWPFTMEIPLDFVGKEFDAAFNGMNTYNNYVDLFRPIGAFPGWGWNGANEFLGYPSTAELVAAYGRSWSGLAVTISIAIGGWCNTIIESDIYWNPGVNWTGNYFVALETSATDINVVTMHELGHTVGLSRGGGDVGFEKYDYPYLTYMNTQILGVTEDGRGLHAAEAINLRANYGVTTSVADMGVESYTASDSSQFTKSWISLPRSPVRPGDTITANELTVENMSQFAHNNVHLRLYLSTDRTINDLDRQYGDWYWPTFWGDSYWEGDLTANVPLDTPPGTYWVGARVSRNGYQGDGYFDNNATFIDYRITVSCTGMFAFSPASLSVPKGGVNTSVALNTIGTACPWTAISSAPSWLHITSTTDGTGPATISYRADANLTSSPRSATISAGGASYDVTQEAGCAATAATPISVWTAVNSALSDADCFSPARDLSGLRPYARRYSFNGTAGQRVVIFLSGGFNTYLYFLDPSGAIIAEDDNGSTFGNSRIPAVSGFFTLPSTGVYTIEATSASAGATGTFRLELMGTVTVSVAPDPVAGSCKNAKGTITLGTAAPAGGTILNLHKWPELAAATMPATFAVPAGATSKTFTITTAAVTASQTGMITADWGSFGDASGADSLTIRPLQPKKLVLSPSSVSEGSTSTATVTLECAAGPAGVTLALSSAKPLRAQPASSALTIPAGATSGTFLVNTFDVSAASTAPIKAEANGKTAKATLTINPIF